ncbi:dipeptidase [Candidatus Protochlamydia phocaeensis]|uniref:dipeptidase n=1 Tax=Candidatus Protochlamydia phocaeensis TaxID=1414722 RepID=UPI00083830C3|nr:membrane dipeptidase [Candidatus Protochlamydia phocaeensis]
MLPIADLHCDLLSYLESQPGRTPHQPVARCSVPQLRAGGVKWQTMAIFTETEPSSVKKGMQQADIYRRLPVDYPKDFVHLPFPLQELQSEQIGIFPAFENASGFCSEQEPLEQGLARLRRVIRDIGKPLYVSLTWNSENRFGGGALTRTGLREDGKRLLEALHEHRIAVDLSHASDALAYDILDYMENKALHMPVLASHSNARAIAAVPRNLPDEIAREIFRRRGVIGLNLYHPFIGNGDEHILYHLAHWLEIGGEKHICVGADFFYEADMPFIQRQGIKKLFFDSYQDASCYPRLLAFIQSEMKLREEVLKGLASQNFLHFAKASG